MSSRERETRLPFAEAPAEGQVRVVEIGGHRVGLFRVEGSLYALADRCPHRGAPLCAGAVATPVEVTDGAVAIGKPASVVRCPWHKWDYEIATGRCLVDEKLRVRSYAVRLEGDDVVVSLDRPAVAPSAPV
ncbi:MAG TPA: Rieske 2Fe-2S domain-containing protein [Gaiellaceae bacterium]|jgi:nitrite reductase/ring-hydroxylating ferredoxin subunit